MNDAKCVSVLVYDKSVIEEVDKDLSETMEKKPQGSTTVKSYNDSSVTSVWEFPRSSSRNKIPASRSSGFFMLASAAPKYSNIAAYQPILKKGIFLFKFGITKRSC